MVKDTLTLKPIYCPFLFPTPPIKPHYLTGLILNLFFLPRITISLPSDCGDPEGVLRKDLPDKYEDESVAQLTPEDDDEDLTMSIPTMGGDDIVLLYSITGLELLDGGTTSTLTTLSSPDGFSVITELDGLAIDHCLSGSDTARVSRMVFGTV